MKRFRSVLAAIAVAVLALAPVSARAEADTVRFAMPYGLGYLPTYVVADRNLIQKHARAAGLGDINVTIRHMASGPLTSDLILAGDADIGMGGWGPAFILWDKTRGPQKVRAITPLSGAPIVLLSVDPRIRTLRDFRDGDRIAMSAIKVTDQAVTLQMAAAREFGWAERFRLDPLTISMSNPDGMAALLSGQSEVKNQFAIPPFSAILMESGKTHVVMTSEDYLTPGSSGSLVYTTARFHDTNPKLYAAVAAAYEDAFAFIAENPGGAAGIYIHHEPQKRDLAWIAALIRDPKMMYYSSIPRGIGEHAEFMFRIGTLKTRPDSWKDLFWENMHAKPGD